MATATYPILVKPTGIQPVVEALASISQTGNTVTVTLASGQFPDVFLAAAVGDTVTIVGVSVTTWNGTWTIATLPTNNTFTYTDPTSRSTSSSVTGYVYFPLISVSTSTPTGFLAGQTLTIANADDATYDGAWVCRYVTSNQHVLVFPLSDPSIGSQQSQNLTDVIPTNTVYNTAQWEVVGASPHQLRTTGTTDGQTILLDYVVADGFGATVPATASILGITADVNFQSQTTSNSFISSLKLYKTGSGIGTAKTPASATYFSTIPQDLILGSSSDLWGNTLLPADVNDSTFGFGVQVQHNIQSGASSQRLFINSFTITIYYTQGPIFSGDGTLSGDSIVNSVTATLVASPTSITSGGTSTLTWTSTGATGGTLIADKGDGSPTTSVVDPNGSRVVSPAVTTKYTFIALSDTSSATAIATVTVSDAPTVVFTAKPSSIQSGGNSTLSWTCTNTSSASINQGIGSITVPSASTTVSPTVTTIYTLTAVGTLGETVTAKAIVVVNGVRPPIPVLNIQPYKISAMASTGSDDHLWICDQLNGNVYASSATDFRDFPSVSAQYIRAEWLNLSASGFTGNTGASAGTVKDHNGNLWFVCYNGGGTNLIHFDEVDVTPPSTLTYANRSAWTATDGQTGGATEVGHPPSDAIDGNLATYWGNGDVIPGNRWITVDTKIAGFEPNFLSFILHNAPGTPTIQFYKSDDNITFTQVGGNLTVDTANITTEQIFVLPVGTSGRYFRLQANNIQALEVTELYLGVTFGGAIDRVSFTLPSPFTVWNASFDTTNGFNNNVGLKGFDYRSFDNKFLLASATSIAAVDPSTQAISGSIFTMPDADGINPILHIAGIATDGHALVYGNQNVYLLDSAQTEITHWTRAGIDPTNSLFGNFGSGFWDSANNIFWVVTNDGSTTRLYKLSLAGTGSILASASIGVNETWCIAWDSTDSKVVGVVANNTGSGNSTLLHTFDATTLADTTHAVPVPSGCVNGDSGGIGVSQDGKVFSQAATNGGAPQMAPIWSLNPLTGATIMTSGTRGGLLDEHINLIGVQFAFAVGLGFTAPSGIVNVTGLVIHINLGVVTAIAGPPPQPRSKPLEFGGYVLHIVPVSRM